jgi:hypothetical protein
LPEGGGNTRGVDRTALPAIKVAANPEAERRRKSLRSIDVLLATQDTPRTLLRCEW